MSQIERFLPTPGQDALYYYTLTPRTLTLCLAYVQRYRPRRLSGRRLLSPGHLIRLSQWIDQPGSNIRSLRAHPTLAGHLALLVAADLLAVTEHIILPTRSVTEWLLLSPSVQIDRLLQAVRHTETWPATVSHLGWSDILTPDFTAYLEQTLARQRNAQPSEDAIPAAWQTTGEADTLKLSLPDNIPVRLLFDLLQLGERLPDGALHLTPLSIASSPACHFGYDHIRWLLETATQTSLPAARRRQLREWLRRARAYRIHGPLLSVARPEQLQAIWQNRRLRPYILEQISPRHALIDPLLIPKLRRWLARQGYPLNQPPASSVSSRPIPTHLDDLDLPAHWFSLRLLLGMQKYLPLPYPAPAAQLFHLEQTLPAATIAELEHRAQHVLQQLEDVIQGRDAFFPAYQSPTPVLYSMIETAMAAADTLHIAYRAVGQYESVWHKIEPLRLEKRAALAYLHAYSHRAQANRTFRLDRITAIKNGSSMHKLFSARS